MKPAAGLATAPTTTATTSAKAAAELQQDQAAEILDPLTGELVSADDVDMLIDLLDSLKKADEANYAAKVQVIRALAAKSPHEKKTERVAGHRRAVKVEHPSKSWDNSKLKEAWNSYPKFREQYLRIGSIEPQLREVDKLRGTSGPADLESFKSIVLAAEREPTSNPRITIEQ